MDGLPTASLDQIPAAELRTTLMSGAPGAIHLVDVRSPREWSAGHLVGAINIPVGEVAAHAATLPRDAVIATICESGFRSSLAASLLAQEGTFRLVNVAGGLSAYRGQDTT